MQYSNKNKNSIEPKTHQYLSNGTGRDYYIKINDGGLNKQNQVRSFTGGKFVMKNIMPKNNKPYCEAKNLFYRSDGTGRDNYIIVNEGGLTQYNREISDYKFVNDLRKYNKEQRDESNELHPDYFIQSQHMKSRQQSLRDTITSRQQKHTTDRLSTPKVTNNPHQYPNVFNKRHPKHTLYQ